MMFKRQQLGTRLAKSLVPMFVEYRNGENDTWHKCQLSRYHHKPPTYVFRQLDKLAERSALLAYRFDSPASAYGFICREARRRGYDKQWRKVDIARMTDKHWRVRGAARNDD